MGAYRGFFEYLGYTPAMSEGNQRRLAAIVSADVVGYSRLMGIDETGTLAALRSHRGELIDNKIGEYGGRIVKTMGDGLLLEFPSVVQATKCMIEVQQGMAERNEDVDDDRRMIFRIGINLGDIIIEGEDIFGDGVNIAARLQETAEPGGLTISRRVHEDVQDRLNVTFKSAGEQILKNIARPVEVWRWSPTQEKAGDNEPPPLPDKPSIAVLAFDNMSGDAEQDYFSDGITEDIITDLSKTSGLFVIARNSSFAYKGRASDMKQVARELGVRYLLEGSVRRVGRKVRINIQLIEPLSGSHLWAERYDGDIEDIFALQDRITESVVATLAVTLTRVEQDRAMHKEVRNLEAYDYVLRGTAYHHRLTKEDNIQAGEMFARAIELDSGYAPAYAGLAWVLVHDANQGWSDNPQMSLQTALENAKRAVRLDDTLAKAHMVLGDVYLWTHQNEEAIFEGRKAIALDPSYADGHFALAVYLHSAGRAEEALAEAKMAIRFNPIHANRFYFQTLSRAHYLLMQYDLAAEAGEQSVSSDPNQPGARVALAIAYAQMGRLEDARRHVEQALRCNPELSLKGYRKHPIKNKADLDHVLDGMRKAGFPEQ